MASFVKGLVSKVYEFSDRVTDLVTASKSVDRLIAKLGEIKLTPECHVQFADVAKQLQNHVAHMELQSLSNMQQWVREVVGRVESVLLDRVREMARLWVDALSNFSPIKNNNNNNNTHDKSSSSSCSSLLGSSMRVFKVILQPHLGLTICPPVEAAHSTLIRCFHTCLSYITHIPRLKGTRFFCQYFSFVRQSNIKYDR